MVSPLQSSKNRLRLKGRSYIERLAQVYSSVMQMRESGSRKSTYDLIIERLEKEKLPENILEIDLRTAFYIHMGMVKRKRKDRVNQERKFYDYLDSQREDIRIIDESY